MEERKLNDEEIIKALECCDSEEVDCKNCPYHKKNMLCFYTRCSDTLDLIHRLQGERKDMHQDLIQAEKYAEKLSIENAEQKAEIERLTEKYEDKLAWQEVDIQQLTEENAELKKQVEVLNREINGFANKLQDAHEERENMQAEILMFEDMKFTQEHCDLYSENETLKQWLKRLNADLENEKNWGKIQTKQAVEERTKEIFDELLKDENVHINVRLDQWGETYNVACVDFDTIEELAKERYGVEVE